MLVILSFLLVLFVNKIIPALDHLFCEMVPMPLQDGTFRKCGDERNEMESV